MFSDVIEILQNIYGTVGPAGTGLAAIFLISGSLAFNSLTHIGREQSRWRLAGAVVTMIISGWLFHHHQHSASGVAHFLEGKWRGPDADCSVPMDFRLDELPFGETDLVVTVADLPNRNALALSDSGPDHIVVHHLGDKAEKSYRRDGNNLIVNSDGRPTLMFYPCK